MLTAAFGEAIEDGACSVDGEGRRSVIVPRAMDQRVLTFTFNDGDINAFQQPYKFSGFGCR
jgi:hypothetical protein